MPLQDKADDASIHPVEAAHDEQIGLEMHIHEMHVYMKCASNRRPKRYYLLHYSVICVGLLGDSFL